jgi:DNA-binding response OmpR family regulator
MDKCPRCGADAVFAGYEDARTFYQCEKCKRVWPMMVAPPPPSARTPVRVLVADDSDLLVGLIASWLEDEGFAVVVATTGRQTLDAAALHQPDVVLLDLIMPQMDGFEVCGKLKSLPRPPEIILMTGISDAAHLRRATDLCATLLRKPLDAETVVAAVGAAALRRRHPHWSVSQHSRTNTHH